jgi:predicted transcriptional regulator
VTANRRPPKVRLDVAYSVRLPADLASALEDAAEAEDRTPSFIIRRALAAYLARPS